MTQQSIQTIVYFWVVRDVQKKLSTVCHLAGRHFVRKERILITTPSLSAARYVDELLWGNPPDSFVPHAISTTHLDAAVVITYPEEGAADGLITQNPNQARVVINLCPTISSLAGSVTCVHELFDQTDAEKQRLSQVRYAAYEAAGFLCCKEMG